MRTCQNCGATAANDELAFCETCGARLEPAAENAPPPPAAAAPEGAPGPELCPQCGTPRKNTGAVFCSQCGYSFAVAAAPPLPGNAPPLPTGAAPTAAPAGTAPIGLVPGGTAPVPVGTVPPAMPIAPKAKKGKGKLVALLLVLLLLVAAGSLGGLYYFNRPDATINAFVAAVDSGDVHALRGMATLQNTSPGSEEWAAFINMFDESPALEDLRAQLQAQSKNPQGGGYSYPSITLKGEPFFLFISRWHVEIGGVSLTLENAAPGTTVYLDGNRYRAKSDETAPPVYADIMPGLYALETAAPSGERQLAEEKLLLAKNTTYEGVVAPSTPENEGEPETPPEDSSTPESTESSSDTPGGDLMDRVSLAEQVTAEEMQSIFSAFYQSYLQCLNNQSTASLVNSATANLPNVEERMQRPGNLANEFKFESVSIDAQSPQVVQQDGTVYIRFNAMCAYSYRGRGSSSAYERSENPQTVELVYQDGLWLVSNFAIITEEEFAAHTLGTF